MNKKVDNNWSKWYNNATGTADVQIFNEGDFLFMKKSLKKVIAVVMSVAIVVAGTSMFAFAADSSSAGQDALKAFNDWIDSLSNYKLEDFYGFITSVLHLFGFTGEFEGVHSIIEFYNQWFDSLGVIGEVYEKFINSIKTSDLIELLAKIFG